jgi:hypothetical protein
MLDHEVSFESFCFCFEFREFKFCNRDFEQVTAVQQLLLHYPIESPPLASISHSKNQGSAKANQQKQSPKPAKQQRKSEL